MMKVEELFILCSVCGCKFYIAAILYHCINPDMRGEAAAQPESVKLVLAGFLHSAMPCAVLWLHTVCEHKGHFFTGAEEGLENFWFFFWSVRKKLS